MKLSGLLLLALLWAPLLRAATLAEAVADPRLWPTEVAVTVMTKATQLRNGQPAGPMLIGAGKKITVTGLAADGVTGKLGGNTIKVAVDKTDLLRRLDPATAPAATEEPTTAAEESPAARTGMQRRLSGKLVRLAGSKVQPVDDRPLNGVKYYGLYFSAGWCGPCRQFTPNFINTYNQIRQKHPEFEVIFISDDHSAEDMRDYMKGDNMPWLALKYELRQSNPELMRYRGSGIPCLVLVDAEGRVLSDSFDGDNYLGPGHVLRDAIRLMEPGQ